MSSKEFIPISKPYITEEEIEEVIKTLKSGWVTTGPKTHSLEQRFKEYFEVDGTLLLSSCTAALHLSLLLLDIKANDEVITTPFTFVSTANVIEHVGATPVFVDIEPDTLNIDATKIENKITNKTKAIMLVHYGGHACDMDEIMKIADKYHISVIEDVAHGMGGYYKGKALGTFGKFGAFSFYSNKNITSMEGGLLIGNYDDIEKARIMSLHGMNRSAWARYSEMGDWFYEVIYPGLKYNMTDVSASILSCQLTKLKYIQERRAIIVNEYQKCFSPIEELQIPKIKPDVIHSWFNYPLRLNLNLLKINRSDFINRLKEKKIGTSVHFIPINLHPYYRNKFKFSEKSFPIANREYERILSLPLYPQMTEEEIRRVTTSVIETVYENRKNTIF